MGGGERGPGKLAMTVESNLNPYSFFRTIPYVFGVQGVSVRELCDPRERDVVKMCH
jgi:hypothetical protein